MSYYLTRIQATVLRTVDQMDMYQWGLILLVVVVIGTLCMRGYGSRKDW